MADAAHQQPDEKVWAALQIARLLAEPGELEVILERVVEQVSAFGEAMCALLLVVEDGASFEVVALRSGDPALDAQILRNLGGKRRPMDAFGDNAPSLRAVRTRRAVVESASDPDAFITQRSPLFLGVEAPRAVCTLPLRTSSSVLGTLSLFRSGLTATDFEDGSVELLQLLADQAALAIANAQLIERVQAELDEHKRTRALLEVSVSERQRAEARFRTALAVGRQFAAASTDLDSLLQTIVERTATHLNAYAGLALLSPDRQFLEFRAQHAANPLGKAYVRRRNELLGATVPATGDLPVARALRDDTPISVIGQRVRDSAVWEALSAQQRELIDDFSVRDYSAIPLRARGEPLGVLSVHRFGERGGHDPELEVPDLELLRLLADQAALAIANAALLRRVQSELAEHERTQATLDRTAAERERADRRMRIAFAAGRRFAAETHDLQRLNEAIVEQAATHLGSYAGLALLSEDASTLLFSAQHAAIPNGAAYIARRNALLGKGVPATGESPIARALRSDIPVFVHDLEAVGVWETLSAELRELVTTYGVRDFGAIPLRAHGKPLGALSIHRFGDHSGADLEPPDVELLRLLADQAALALSNAQLLDRVRRELHEHAVTRNALNRSEENFRQAQRMEAVGRLAGGVAHDFNNILSVVIGYAELALEKLLPGDPLHPEIEEIRRGGVRAGELTQQLLAFSRKQILAPRIIDLNEVVEGVQKMLTRLVGEDVEVRVVLQRPLEPCSVDPGQMEQVLLNLVVNARDAMPQGGLLTVETAMVELDQHYVDEHPDSVPGLHVVLAVSDTGVGMDHETRTRIFEPFFTTKPKDSGTGLGLATVYGIVKQSNGSIWVYSEPGQGTTFKIYLPRAMGRAETAGPTARQAALQAGGKETVLVVEDDAAVRNLVRGVLSRAGYHVMLAANGGEALLLCEQHGATIHLLLTDVVMPRMSGRQLADRLRTIRPGLRVLYMSGYTENAIVHHGVLDSDVEFIPKPITPHALLQRVREVLDRTS